MFKNSTSETPTYLTDKFLKSRLQTNFMARSFAYVGPKLCNFLSNSTKSASLLVAFGNGLEDLDFDVLLYY